MPLKHLAFIFLFDLFFSSLHEIQSRDARMFNKIPSQPNLVEVEVKQQEQNLPKIEANDPVFNPEQQQEQVEQPNFIPENTDNNYGIYGHEAGQLPPSTQTQNNNNFPYNAKYLPKNAYVTQPEDFKDNTFTENRYTNTQTINTNNYQLQDNDNTYYNGQKQVINNGVSFTDTEENTSDNDNTNDYFNNDVISNNNNFNARFIDAYNSMNREYRVNREPQGMSDTRIMENGKYYYDIISGKYSRDHPYVNPTAMRNQYNPPGYNNIENNYQYNNYNEEEQYQNENSMP